MADSSFLESDRPVPPARGKTPSPCTPSEGSAESRDSGDGPGGGDISAVWEQVYGELHALARAYMAREDRRITLQPTALVHEAFVKLSRQDPATLKWNDRAHFFRIAASAMRQILVDHARRRRAQGAAPCTISSWMSEGAAEQDTHGAQIIDVIDLDEALTELARLDDRKARVVELRFFGGLTGIQIGAALDISPKTVETDWYFSRSWLRSRMSLRTANGP